VQERERRRFAAVDKSKAVKRPKESGQGLQQVADELGTDTNQLRSWRTEQITQLLGADAGEQTG
jgi:transposase-like protein